MAKLLPEKKLQNKIIKFLSDHSYSKGGPLYYYKRTPNDPCYIKGSCDIFCVIHGKHIEIELKAKNGSPSADQDRWRRIVENILECPYLITDDYDEFLTFINKYL